MAQKKSERKVYIGQDTRYGSSRARVQSGMFSCMFVVYKIVLGLYNVIVQRSTMISLTVKNYHELKKKKTNKTKKNMKKLG